MSATREENATGDAALSSLAYLYDGSTVDFVAALKREVLAHRAVNHPYLQALAGGAVPDIGVALMDYAHQYSFYSDYFVQYIDAVLINVDNQAHRDILLENLLEEQGIPGSANLEDRPHVEIFRHMKKTIGIDASYETRHPPSTTVLVWRELFLQKCGTRIPGVGLAAIGLATEFIVPHFYPYLIEAIEKHTTFGEDASLFFRLHVDCDAEHSESIIDLILELAETISTREAIRFAALSSLNLRNAFWDVQYARTMAKGALAPSS